MKNKYGDQKDHLVQVLRPGTVKEGHQVAFKSGTQYVITRSTGGSHIVINPKRQEKKMKKRGLIS